MKNRDARSVLLLMCLSVAFFCLLISGFPRLIAGGEESPMQMDKTVMHAAMIGAPAPNMNGETGSGENIEPRPRAERPAACALRIDGGQPIALRSDANGNVLGHRSYLHTVYRAFALGDGFV